MSNLLPSVLIVDDNDDFCASLFDCFEDHDFDVNASIDAVTALYLAQSRNYDLAIIDLNMPGMSGLTLFRRMRQVCPRIRGLLMTGDSNGASVADARRAGFDRVIDKPFDFPSLVQIARETSALPVTAAADPTTFVDPTTTAAESGTPHGVRSLSHRMPKESSEDDHDFPTHATQHSDTVHPGSSRRCGSHRSQAAGECPTGD